MKKFFAFALAVLLAVGMNDALAERGGNGKGKEKSPGFSRARCSKTANSTRSSCIRTCQNTFKDANRVCQAKDLFTKECMDACFGARDLCVIEAKTPLTGCLTAANDALETALVPCASLLAMEKYTCENNARLDADAARLACQAEFKANAAAQTALSTCLSTASTCVKGCKSIPTPIPTATVAAGQ